MWIGQLQTQYASVLISLISAHKIFIFLKKYFWKINQRVLKYYTVKITT